MKQHLTKVKCDGCGKESVIEYAEEKPRPKGWIAVVAFQGLKEIRNWDLCDTCYDETQSKLSQQTPLAPAQ